MSKELSGLQYFTARIRKSQLQLSVQSQNGIKGNSNILIFIFQVKGICLHEKMGIQLQTKPDNPHLTNEHKKACRGRLFVFVFWAFFKDALIPLEDVNQESMQRTDLDSG